MLSLTKSMMALLSLSLGFAATSARANPWVVFESPLDKKVSLIDPINVDATSFSGNVLYLVMMDGATYEVPFETKSDALTALAAIRDGKISINLSSCLTPDKPIRTEVLDGCSGYDEFSLKVACKKVDLNALIKLDLNHARAYAQSPSSRGALAASPPQMSTLVPWAGCTRP
jgi:hypothetical protein